MKTLTNIYRSSKPGVGLADITIITKIIAFAVIALLYMLSSFALAQRPGKPPVPGPCAAPVVEVSGSRIACISTSVPVSFTATLTSGTATGYNWTVPNGWDIASGQGSAILNVYPGSSSGNVKVTANNNCGSSTDGLYVATVTCLPDTDFPCIEIDACFEFHYYGPTFLPGNLVKLTFVIYTHCNHDLSYAAFSVPTGTTPTWPNNNYTSLYNYTITNPTNNPFYSIKYDANNADDSYKNGQFDVFEYIMTAADFALVESITVQAKANGYTGRVVFDGDCGGIDPLPVQLMSFNAARAQSAVLLDWATATETNNQGFEVERSTDGQNFSKIGDVAGNGTANQEFTYRFTDSNPPKHIAYYRLKQIDYDGRSEYSPVRSVASILAGGITQLHIFPNPTPGRIKLDMPDTMPDDAAITIVAVTGQTVYSGTAGAIRTSGQEIDISSLTSGIYILNIDSGTNKQSLRINKL